MAYESLSFELSAPCLFPVEDGATCEVSNIAVCTILQDDNRTFLGHLAPVIHSLIG